MTEELAVVPNGKLWWEKFNREKNKGRNRARPAESRTVALQTACLDRKLPRSDMQTKNCALFRVAALDAAARSRPVQFDNTLVKTLSNVAQSMVASFSARSIDRRIANIQSRGEARAGRRS
jgi:hypothetical protein